MSNFNLHDDKFENILKNPSHEDKNYIYHYMIGLAICHSIIVEKDESNEGKLNYLSSSPDEMALINCARYFKYIFKGKDIDNKITLNIQGIDYEFKLLHTLEYSSER